MKKSFFSIMIIDLGSESNLDEIEDIFMILID